MSANIPRGYEMYSLPGMGGGQKELYDMLKGQFQQGGGDILKNLFSNARGDVQGFEGQEKYGMDLFNQKIAPGIANRYAGSGIGSSSGMQNALAGAGGNLASELHSKRSDLMQKSIQDVLGLGERLLGMPTEHFGLSKQSEGPNFTELFSQAGGAIPGFLAELFRKKGSGEGIDWSSIGSGVSKILPMLLSL